MSFLQNDYQSEIERCIKIYDGFKDAAPFLSSVYNDIADYLNDHEDFITPDKVEIDENRAAESIRSGQVLGLLPVSDYQMVVDLLRVVTEAIEKNNPGLVKVMQDVRAVTKSIAPELQGKDLHHSIFCLRDTLIKQTVLKGDMATLIFYLAYSTIYRLRSKPASDFLKTDMWEGGNCPLCGELPHFGMLRSGDGAKLLECWLCGTTWPHVRIKCPFCDNEEQENLGYFTVNEGETCRVHYCKKCSHYYKIFDTRKFNADSNPVLAIHNLASLNHDLAAEQEGFKPGSVLEWVNREELTNRQH